MNRVFRFDDVCVNADMQLINDMTDFLLENFSGCRIIWGVSPLVHDMSQEKCEITKQRIFPKIFNAHSDHRIFYTPTKVGVPELRSDIDTAGHGLIHVDHRLLTKEAQEMSIITSCSFAQGKTFIPPFNKWDKNTESICEEFGIELIKFEDGWLCMEYNDFNPEQKLWYLHSREFTLEDFKEWLKTG